MITQEQILEYKWFLIAFVGVLIYYFYTKFSNRKSETTLKQEYNKILTSEEHKVKSQFD